MLPVTVFFRTPDASRLSPNAFRLPPPVPDASRPLRLSPHGWHPLFDLSAGKSEKGPDLSLSFQRIRKSRMAPLFCPP